MNIYIPDSWLKEYLKTEAGLKEIAKFLSLTSASVEKVEKVNDDFRYYLEITTNRVDMLSVLGVARELAAVLPEFNLKAKLIKSLPKVNHLKTFKKVNYLKVIANSSLCLRFTAVLLSIEKIGQTPVYIQERLKAVGVRSLNPIIDVTNYLMFELGQPMHVFDYDKIKDHLMILRESQTDEEIITLDGLKRKLPKGSIVIEDGAKRLIDLCGIMGAENSCVDSQTTQVLLFVQNYDPVKIRKAIQALNFRTEAATRFEKGLDSEMVLPALSEALSLYQKILKVKKISPILDLYPKKIIPKTINLKLNQVETLMGIKLNPQKIISILKRLDFKIKTQGEKLKITVPSSRANDVLIAQDIIEEIARVFGYQNLPSHVPQTDFLLDTGWQKFALEKEVKQVLSDWGFTEIYSCSMISEKELTDSGFHQNSSLKIANPLTKEGVFMRPSIIPSLLTVIFQNQNNFPEINIFELSRIYLKGKNELPDEPRHLNAFSTDKSFFAIKGIVEALLEKLNITEVEYRYLSFNSTIWENNQTAEVIREGRVLGVVGIVNDSLLAKFGIKKKISGFDLNFEELEKAISKTKVYQPIPLYPAIIEDLTFIFPEKTLFSDVLSEIYHLSKLVSQVEYRGSFQDAKTFRIYYQKKEGNLSDKEVKELREKILKRLKEKFGLKLKEK